MNNLNVKNYKDYVEVVNGLFVIDKGMFEVGLDDPEEFTFRQGGTQIVPKKLSGVFNILPQYEPPQEFVPLTRQQIEEAVNRVFVQERPIHERDVVLYTGNPFIEDEYNRVLQEGVQREVERARIENERLSLHLSNMSEQQLLEHFDRISQEEEN